MLINNLPDSIINSYLDMLCYSNWKTFEPFTIIICAHPDDETISMGSRLKKIKNALLVYLTNGAPANPFFHKQAGYYDNTSYSRARREELLTALSIAGFSESECIFLDFPDQETSFNIPAIAKELASIFALHEPAMVLTHPYEGGHPDHDSAALAVHLALQNNLLKNSVAPVAIEFTSYHSKKGELVTNKFPDNEKVIQRDVVLTTEEKIQKQQMINCFLTQLEFLMMFSLETESFRQIPEYNFTNPPVNEKLFYEYFDWGMTGERWRKLAEEALIEFGLYE